MCSLLLCRAQFWKFLNNRPAISYHVNEEQKTEPLDGLINEPLSLRVASMNLAVRLRHAGRKNDLPQLVHGHAEAEVLQRDEPRILFIF